MPLYDYVCTRCGHRMEIMHSVHAHGPAACPVCGGAMKKAYAPPAVHFKGTGWARKERSSSRPARKHPGGSGGSGEGGSDSGASAAEPAGKDTD